MKKLIVLGLLSTFFFVSTELHASWNLILRDNNVFVYHEQSSAKTVAVLKEENGYRVLEWQEWINAAQAVQEVRQPNMTRGQYIGANTPAMFLAVLLKNLPDFIKDFQSQPGTASSGARSLSGLFSSGSSS